MQKFSTFRVLFLAILYFKAGKEARCSFFILQRALVYHEGNQRMEKKAFMPGYWATS